MYSIMILFYWFFLSGVIFLAGAYVSRVYVTVPSGAEACFAGSGNKSLGEIGARYIFLAAVLALLANAIHFILHCSIMTGTPLEEVFPVLSVFITKTKYGRFTILRTLFLGAVMVVSFINHLHDRRWATFSGVLFSMLLLIVIAMSGHQGVRGYMNFPFVLDVLHLIAVSIWIGGIMFIRYFLSALVRGFHKEFWKNLITLTNRFSLLATFCAIIAALTGVLLAYVNVKGFPALVNMPYGVVLLIKIFMVGVILILGAINKFSVIPIMNNFAYKESAEILPHGRRMLTLVTIEACLGLVVLLLTSLLTHLSPEG